MNTYQFGTFLSQLRKEKGLTQLQLAEKLNVTDKAISRWETGKNFPDIEIFEDLSKVLDVSISELLEGKRIEKENLFTVSEEHIVTQIKKNRKNSKNYRIIICVILIISVIFGYIALKETGIFDGVIYNKIPCYSNDVLTIMNNLDGYISQRPDADGDFIIDNCFFQIEPDKTTNDIFYLSGTCENGRAFYANTMYKQFDPDSSYCFVGEFRENQECVDGICFRDLKQIISQMDLSLLPDYKKYEFNIHGVHTYNKENFNSNDYQKSIKKFVFSNGVLNNFSEEYLSDNFLLITVIGFEDGTGKTIAYILYKK